MVHISRDGGASWQNVTPPELPEWSLVSIIEPSPHEPTTAYLAATRYKLDDTAPYLFKSSDYGATWTKITGNLPDGSLTRVIREDPHRRGLLTALLVPLLPQWLLNQYTTELQPSPTC